MHISDLESKKIAIWGLGTEGKESLRFLREKFPEKHILLINQDIPDDIPSDSNVSVILECDLLDHLDDFDVIIKAPGISLYHPLVRQLTQNNIIITSATNIWFAQEHSAPLIAITGSNGKSTTSALLTHILKGLGFKAELGGNIGIPLLSLSQDAEYYVIELSSYQTADLNYAPDIAVLLNLFPEHIQWHKSHLQYYSDKCNLINAGAKINILNRTDPITQRIITQSPQNTVWFNDQSAVHVSDTHFYHSNNIIGSVESLLIPGKHNQENICAALTICQQLGLNLKKCFKWAALFSGLQHRLENLGTYNGITYINDSISTTPEATLAALKSFEGKEISLLVGGQDRQQDYSDLIQYCRHHTKIKIITMYETGPKVAQEMQDNSPSTNLTSAKDLKNAIDAARAITPDNGITLLSPAAPSYDAFQNFEERGQIFSQYVRKNSE